MKCAYKHLAILSLRGLSTDLGCGVGCGGGLVF